MTKGMRRKTQEAL